MKKNKFKNKKLISNYLYYIALFVMFFVFGFLSVYLFFQSINLRKDNVIDYSEDNSIDYKVYLNDNEFYDTEFLEKDMIYVSSLIKSISVDYNYSFKTSQFSDMNFSYKVMGELLITDANDTKTFYKKEYVLVESKTSSFPSSNHFIIDQHVDVDYMLYNSIANKYRQSYGLNSKSVFIVSLVVDKNSADVLKDLSESHSFDLRIPLSEKEVNISIDSNDYNNSGKVLTKGSISIDDFYLFGLFIVIMTAFIVVFVLVIIELIAIIPRRSKYEKKVNKILREYDRLIAETYTPPDKKGLKVIEIHDFVELLDVHDNIKLPIICYKDTKNKKCIFYITSVHEIYLYELLEKDMK